MSRQIQQATSEDLKDIAELVNGAYRGDSSRAGWTTEADFLDGQRTSAELLASEIHDGGQILCLREEEQLLGVVFLRRLAEKNPASCYLGMLTIRPHLQARGLGRSLLQAAEETARHWGCRRMRMSVIQIRHSLIAWYERLGYQRTNEILPFPYGDPNFGIPKRDDLHFIVLEKDL